MLLGQQVKYCYKPEYDRGNLNRETIDMTRTITGSATLNMLIAHLCAVLIFVFFSGTIANAAIIVNGTTSNAQTTGATSLTWSHTVIAGTSQVLFVEIAIDGLGAAVSGVTYGGTSLTRVGRGSGNHAVEIWRLINPAAGTANVVINFSATTAAAAGSTAFTGVDQNTPNGTFVNAAGTGLTASVTAVSAVGDEVLDVQYWKGAPTGGAPGAGQTINWWQSSGVMIGGSTVIAGAASVSMTGTFTSSTQWEIGAVSIKADLCPGNLVTTITDTGEGSLRECIIKANANPGTTISFNIATAANQASGSDSWWRIAPASALPSITAANTAIDGTTQSNKGDTNSKGPEIEIYGAGAGAGVIGLTVNNVANAIIKGVTISGFPGSGIFVTGAGSTGTKIQSNYIGTTATGDAALGNKDFGIFITGGASNIDIGGSNAGEGNILSGNGDTNTEPGIGLSISSTIRILGNKIGTDRTGMVKIANSGPGISINGADGATIGGTTTADRNIISGNTSQGISITDWSRNITIQGNYIGVGATGTETNLGNGSQGIYASSFYNPSANIIGGTASGAGNIIAYNTDGLYLDTSGTGNQVVGNTIRNNGSDGLRSLSNNGLYIAKNLVINNGAVGVRLANTANKVYHNTIHGNNTGLSVESTGTTIRNNIITGNTGYGINRVAASMTESYNLVTGNSTTPANGSGQSNVALDTTSLNANPLYVNSAGGDFTLQNSSPAINRGIDLVADQPDMNGATAGLYNGYAPDMGYWESSITTTCPVYSTADSGTGTLRACITYANSNTGITINFSISGSAPYTITLASLLPSIIKPVTIDGTSQPGFSGTPLIVLNGNNTITDGLELYAGSGGSTVRGLIFQKFGQDGIDIAASNGNTIAGNWTGLNSAGTAAVGGGYQGINIWDSSNNIIGGITAADRNVLSGNSWTGIYCGGTSTGNQIRGNYIGTNAAGTAAVGNANYGIDMLSSGNTIGGTSSAYGNVISGSLTADGIILEAAASNTIITANIIGLNAAGTAALGNAGVGVRILSANNTIGGNSAALRNIISGNSGAGVYLQGVGATGNSIKGNYIGTDITGAAAVGNGIVGNVEGVGADGASNNTIGGTAAGDGNRIWYNGTAGIAIQTVAGNATGNAILGNSISANVGTIGIDLSPWGVTTNNGTKSAALPNYGMDFPVFTSAALNGVTLTVAGYVGSAANQATFANARVEIFKADNDASGYGEGQTYLGFLTTNASGNFNGTLDVTAKGLNSGDRITATATDASNNTSEFGLNVTVVGYANLAVTLTGNPDPSAVDGDLLYTMVITNNGPNTANSVTLTNVLPAGVTLVSANPSQGSCSGTTTITCALGNMLNTATASVEIMVITPTAGNITDSVSVTASETDIVPANNSASVTTQVVAGITTRIPLSLYRRVHGFVDSSVTGGSLRTASNSVNPCALGASSTASLSGIPVTATIVNAYLYWAGSGSAVDSQITLDGSSFTADRTFTARYVLGAKNYDYFGGFKDVTTQIQSKRNGSYTFSGLTVDSSALYCQSSSVLAGWSLIVIYSDNAVSGKTIVLYDGFDIRRNESTSYNLTGIFAASPPEAKTTMLVWEGDSDMSGGGEALKFNGSDLSDALNPLNNIYNSTINSLGSSSSYGLDLDTFDVTSHVTAKDTLATTTLSTGADLVILNAVLLQVKSNIITGTVFEDVNYGGGAGRNLATAAAAAPGFTVARPGATVELYDSTGSLLRSTTTDSSGLYGFAGMPDGDYTVRVVNSTVTSSRTGASGSERAVQTYRTDASTATAVAVTNEVGGVSPDLLDAPANVTNANLAAIVAQSKAPVKIITGVTVADVNFGYNFDTVVNKNSTGQGSLVQALTNANTLGSDASLAQSGRTAAIENIILMISNGTTGGGGSLSLAAGGLRAANNYFTSGVATITPGASFAITASIVIDAQTQPGWTANPILEINGTTAGGACFAISASGSTLRGFTVNRCPTFGIDISTSSNTIQGCWAGLDKTGTSASANGIAGIQVSGSNNLIGGTTAVQRNVVSGNTNGGNPGIMVTGATNTTITGNYIGTNASGTAAIAGQQDGIQVTVSSGTTIGGTAAGAGNVISGQSSCAVWVNTSTTNTTIQGNRIGLAASGSIIVANNCGIYADRGATGVSIGGTAAGAGNIISGNGGIAVNLGANLGAATGCPILGNSIYANGGLGIDLNVNGVTLNNGTKNASLPNNDMDFPVFTSTVLSGTSLTVAGYVGSAPNQATFANARVEVFKSDNDASGYGEGQTYLGFLTTDASGNFSGTLDVTGKGLNAGDKVTGTATDGSNNTSEFGSNNTVAAPGYQPDAMIKLASEAVGAYLTDNLYESIATLQSKSQGSVSGSVSSYTLQFQNDGNLTDSIIITGTGGNASFTVHYLDETSTDRTAAVTGAGYTIAGVTSGSARVWTLNVTPAAAVFGGTAYTTLVTATSATDSAKKDQVKAVTSSASANITLMKSANKGTAKPGEDISYSTTASNGSGLTTASGIALRDPIPANTGFKTGSASFAAGTSTLFVTISYSNNSGTTWAYVPVSGGCSAPAGYDYCVTDVKWVMTGSMPAATSFSVGIVTRVK
jgi:uncharacterized repeat protein (TIGR01451 family)